MIVPDLSVANPWMTALPAFLIPISTPVHQGLRETMLHHCLQQYCGTSKDLSDGEIKVNCHYTVRCYFEWKQVDTIVFVKVLLSFYSSVDSEEYVEILSEFSLWKYEGFQNSIWILLHEDKINEKFIVQFSFFFYWAQNTALGSSAPMWNPTKVIAMQQSYSSVPIL